MKKFSINWSAPEYEYQRKDTSWYWISILVSIILLAIALWQKNFLFGAFVVIAEATLIFTAGRRPPIWNFEINEDGIRVGDRKSYRFSDIAGFDIHKDTEEYHRLVLKLNRRFSPYLVLRIPVLESDTIEEKLEQIIEREHYDEQFNDSLSKFLKF